MNCFALRDMAPREVQFLHPAIGGGYPPTNFPPQLLSLQAAPCTSEKIQKCPVMCFTTVHKHCNCFALLDIAPWEVQFLHPDLGGGYPPTNFPVA